MYRDNSKSKPYKTFPKDVYEMLIEGDKSLKRDILVVIKTYDYSR